MDGIKELAKNDIINIVQEVSQNEFIVNLTNLFFDTSKKFFILITQEEIHKVLNNKDGCLKLLHYYVILLSTLVHNNVKTNTYLLKDTGATPQDILVNMSKISKATIHKYNDILEKLNLIYIYHTEDLKRENGLIKSFANVYGRYVDKDKIIKTAQIRVERYGYNTNKDSQIVSKISTKQMKSCSILYRKLVDGREPYNDEKMKAIYEYVLEYNRRYNNNNPKSTHFFKGYDFYNEDTS